jgi:hypothetical protein
MSNSFWTAISKFWNPIEAYNVVTKTTLANYCDRLKDQGIVTQMIQPGVLGRVRFQATTWFALCPYDAVMSPNTFVRVVGKYNATTLIVEPIYPMTLANPDIEQVS